MMDRWGFCRLWQAALFFSASAILGFADCMSVDLSLRALDGTAVDISLSWDDEWFSCDSTAYNHELARITCAFSDVAYIDVNANDGLSSLFSKDLEKIGMKEQAEFFYSVDYQDANFGKDQCAFCITSKVLLDSRVLIFLIVRGTPIGIEEWISNLNINDDADKKYVRHEGFSRAALQIEEMLNSYIVRHEIERNNAVLLVTGHSRGAAVACIIAADMLAYFPAQSIYAYTYAAPNVTTQEDAASSQYDYIFNITNAEDIVAYVPFNRGQWRYKKYGRVLTLVNAWNTDSDTFDGDYLARKNFYHELFDLRPFYPFYLGPFLPVQMGSVFVKQNANIDSYYDLKSGWRYKMERAMNMLVSMLSSMGNADAPVDESLERPQNFQEKVMAWVNKKTNGLLEWTAFAVYDAHDSKSYLSWLLALEADEAYSTLGYCQIVVDGLCEGAIIASDDTVKLRVIDGKVKYKSLKRPVVARPITARSFVLAVPCNTRYDWTLVDEGAIPSLTTVYFERYDSNGTLLFSSKPQHFWIGKYKSVRLELGEAFLESDSIKSEKVEYAQAQAVIKKADIDYSKAFRIMLDAALDNDSNFEIGLRVGRQRLYGMLITGISMHDTDERFDLSLGVGRQNTLCGSLAFDYSLLLTSTWAKGELASGDHEYNLVPQVRLGILARPTVWPTLFATCAFDFNITDFNDAVFYDDMRRKVMGSYDVSSMLSIYPRIIVGLRF